MDSSIKAVLLALAAWTYGSAVFAGPATPPPAMAGSFAQRVWTTEDGLPQNSVTDLLQTRDGFLWISTFGGLARFDGFTFTVYDMATSPGLTSNRILSLCQGENGELWLGMENDGVVRQRDGVFREVLGRGRVWSMLHTSDGLWLATDSGVLLRRNGAWTTFDESTGLPYRVTLDIARDGGGTIWAATLGGLARFAEGRFTHAFDRLPERESSAYAIATGESGECWFATAHGVVRQRDGVFDTALPASPGISDFKRVLIHGNRVWLGNRSGVYYLDAGTTPQRIPELDVHVRTLLYDFEGNVWVGCDGDGLVQLRPRLVHRLTTKDGLPDPRVRAVAEAPNGDLWVGAGCEGPSVVRGGELVRVPRAGDRPLGCVRAFLPVGPKELWIAHDHLLTRMRDGTVTHYGPKGGLPVRNIHGLYMDDEGGLWVGYDGAGVVRMHEGEMTSWTTDDGLASNQVVHISGDRSGGVWLGTNAGASRYHGGTFTSLTHSDGLAPGPVRTIHQDADGVVWFGTYGGGLSRLEDGQFTVYTSATGLPDNAISSIVEDDNGNFWLLCNCGAVYVRRAELNAFADGAVSSFKCVLFDLTDGMPEGNGGSQNAGWRAEDGSILFATIDGLARIDPRRSILPQTSPPVAITRVVSHHADKMVDGSVELSTDDRDVEFHYTAITFTRPRHVQFHYRLLGYDDDWNEACTRRTAYYTKLPPGTYEFQVTASVNAGPWNADSATTVVEIPPHFYETRWFAVSSLVMLAVLVVVIHALRVRGIRAHNRRLRAEILGRKRAEAARARLENQLRHVQKMEALGSLAGGVAHDFNNLLTVIQGHAELLQSTERPPERKLVDAERILESTNRGAQLTSQLLALSRKQVLGAALVDPGRLVAEFKAMLEPALGEDVEINIRTVERDLHVRAVSGQLQQVILNLAINARDAMPDGGTLTITVDTVSLDSDSNEYEVPSGEYVAITVRDTGHGMAPDVKDRVFEPFFTTKEHGKGTGLGLSTVHEIVRQCGGGIHLQSTPGAGTTVRVVLPLVSATEEKPAETDQIAATGPIRACNIMVVEDDVSVRELMRECLRHMGHRAIEAGDGAEALTLMEEMGEQIQLVVSDVVMPKMSGPAMVAELRKIQPSVRVILVSGYPDKASMSTRSNDYAFLSKPFTAEALRAKINEVLASSVHDASIHL